MIPEVWRARVETETERLGVSKAQVYLRALEAYFQDEAGQSWDTLEADEHYDPHRFYTRTSDAKGHSKMIRLNVPNPIMGEVAALVQSAQIPAYRSIEDVARDALYHRLKQVAISLDNGELEAVVDLAMLVSDELDVKYQREQAQHLIAMVQDNATQIVAEGPPARARKYLADRRELADSLPEPYRERYLKVVDDFDERVKAAEAKQKRKHRR
jgi:HPt (histidine-containing phosphotransfer) domain-containing protein